MENNLQKPPTGFYRKFFETEGIFDYRIALANQPMTNCEILSREEHEKIIAMFIDKGSQLPNDMPEKAYYKWYALGLCKKELLLIKPQNGATISKVWRTGELYFTS
jgi:hypothetical protein